MVIPGCLLDGYRLIRPIGRGGFGEVWLCQLEVTGELKALKILPASDPRQLERELAALIRYRAVVAPLTGSNLLKIEHVNRVEEGLFYVMPLADGVPGVDDPNNELWQPLTLASLIARRTAEPTWFGAQEIREVMLPVIDAVQRLNDAGVVHRDIKPENILFLHGRPCLGDIGLLTSDTVQITRRGTPGYAAPSWYLESGANPDMWGLATTLYTLVTGNNPDKIGRGAFLYPPQGEASVEMPAWDQFHQAIFRATNGDAAERFLHLDDFAKALSISQSGLSQGPPPVPSVNQTRARSLAPAVAVGILFALAVGGLLWRFYPSSRVPHPSVEVRELTQMQAGSKHDEFATAASRDFEKLLAQAEARFLRVLSSDLPGKANALEEKLLNNVNSPIEKILPILDEMEGLAPRLFEALSFPTDEEYRKCFADLHESAELPTRMAKNAEEDLQGRRVAAAQRKKVDDFKRKSLSLLADYSVGAHMGKPYPVYARMDKIQLSFPATNAEWIQQKEDRDKAIKYGQIIRHRIMTILRNSLPEETGESREILDPLSKVGM